MPPLNQPVPATPVATSPETIPDVTPRPILEESSFVFGEDGSIGIPSKPMAADPNPVDQGTVAEPAPAYPAQAPPQSGAPVNQPPANQDQFSAELASQLHQGRQAQTMLATLFRDHGERIIPLLRGDSQVPQAAIAAEKEKRDAQTKAKCKELFGDAGDAVGELVITLSDERFKTLYAQEMEPVQKQLSLLNGYYTQQQCREVSSGWERALVTRYGFPPVEASEVVASVMNHPSMQGADPQKLHATIQHVLLEYLPGRQVAPQKPATTTPSGVPVSPTVPRTQVAARMAPSAPMMDMRRAGALVTGTGAPGDSAAPTDQRTIDMQILRESQDYGGFGR